MGKKRTVILKKQTCSFLKIGFFFSWMVYMGAYYVTWAGLKCMILLPQTSSAGL